MKQSYYKLIVTIVLLFTVTSNVISQSTSNSAQQFMQDVHGKPVFQKSDFEIQGSPFYPEQFLKATLYLKTGVGYADVPVRFDLQRNIVLYLLSNGTENEMITPVQKIIFTESGNDESYLGKTFESGFSPIDSFTTYTFYEVIVSGQLQLLKHYGLKVTDQKFYGQAKLTRVFDPINVLYLSLSNGKMVKAEKEIFLSSIEEKKNDLEQYIKKENLKLKKESEWKKLVVYYNSLFAS